MNSGFEDVKVLAELLKVHAPAASAPTLEAYARAFAAFQAARK